MTAAFRSASTVTTTSDTVTVTKPTGTVDGDVLIAGITWGNGTTLALSSAPSGWTLLQTVDAVTAPEAQLRVYSKVASGEGASWSWVLSGTPVYGAVGAVCAYSAGNATPVDVSAAAESSGGTTVTAPTITTTDTNERVVVIYASNWAAQTWTPPSGTTERVDAQSGSGNHAGTLGIADYIQATAASTGTKVATASGDNDSGIGCQVALKNAAAGGLKGTLSLLGVGQ